MKLSLGWWELLQLELPRHGCVGDFGGDEPLRPDSWHRRLPMVEQSTNKLAAKKMKRGIWVVAWYIWIVAKIDHLYQQFWPLKSTFVFMNPLNSPRNHLPLLVICGEKLYISNSVDPLNGPLRGPWTSGGVWYVYWFSF